MLQAFDRDRCRPSASPFERLRQMTASGELTNHHARSTGPLALSDIRPEAARDRCHTNNYLRSLIGVAAISDLEGRRLSGRIVPIASMCTLVSLIRTHTAIDWSCPYPSLQYRFVFVPNPYRGHQ